MPDPSPARPAVLLLADGVREEWGEALTAGGLDVATTGWLDGVTAARLRRPDVVLVSTDLPDNAARMVCNAFRMSVDLAGLPLIIAGPGADQLDQESALPTRADLYVPAPVDVAALDGIVREAVRVARVPLVRRPARQIAIGLMGTALLAMGVHLLLKGFHVRVWGTADSPATEWVIFGTFVAAMLAAVAVGFAGRTRSLNVTEKRSTLGRGGFLLWWGVSVVPGHGFVGRFGALSLALLAWAAWAWLGPQARPRTPGVRRAFLVLAGALVVLAAAPWAMVLWVRR